MWHLEFRNGLVESLNSLHNFLSCTWQVDLSETNWKEEMITEYSQGSGWLERSKQTDVLATCNKQLRDGYQWEALWSSSQSWDPPPKWLYSFPSSPWHSEGNRKLLELTADPVTALSLLLEEVTHTRAYNNTTLCRLPIEIVCLRAFWDLPLPIIGAVIESEAPVQ